MCTRPPSIAVSSQTAPYDTFLFRSAARPDRHQLARAQPGVVGDRQQRVIAQFGERVAAGIECGTNIDPARCVGEWILDRTFEPERGFT